ncbi:dihydroneopterin aldolase [Gammaproteobacteria bacterium]|nr:dihydroneopterin aldolase [Gammaproteobacteria bacterium]
MKDTIYIKDLRVQTIIGIFGWERKVRQEVSIDLEMSFDCKKAAKNDAIEDTLDYKKITKGLIKFVEESSFQLQESLAEGIASLVKNEYKVESIKLRVSKPGALRYAEDVGVIIHR